MSYIFTGGFEPVPIESADANCSGNVDVDDLVYLINYFFTAVLSPCDPDGDNVPDC